MMDGIMTGGCACASVRFAVRGSPLRAGLCHCMTCRKGHGSAFNPFMVFSREQVEISGTLQGWESSISYERLFCPLCGSRVVSRVTGDAELELSLGSFDEPGRFTPEYEVWITRREPWLQPLPVPQHNHAR